MIVKSNITIFFTYNVQLDSVRDVVLEIVDGSIENGRRDDRRYVGLVSTSAVTLGDGEHHSRVVHAEECPNVAGSVEKELGQRWRKSDTTCDIFFFRGFCHTDKVVRSSVPRKSDSFWFISWKHIFQVTLWWGETQEG